MNILNMVIGASSIFDKKEVYNIIEIDANTMVLEVPVPGFSRDELAVNYSSGGMYGVCRIGITGKKSVSNIAKYLYKGFDTDTFSKTFPIGTNSSVEKVDYSEGILSIYIHDGKKQSNFIKINESPRSYLTERDDIV